MREPERGGTTAGTIRSSLSRVVLAAFVPLALIGAWQGYLAYRDSRELVANRLRANVWSMMDRSRDTFVIAHHSLEMGAENAAVQSISDQCDAVLARMGGQSAGIANIIRTDATGRVRCSGLPFRAGTRLDAHPWWQAARATGTVVLGEPQVGEISGRPMVVMAQPLYAADGSFSGTLSAGIDLGVLEGELRQGVRHLKGAALIVNGQGRSILAAGRRPPSRVGDPRKARFDAQLIRNQTGRGWVYVAAPLFGEAIYIVYAEGSSSFAARAFGRTWPILALPLLAALLALAAIWFGTQRLLLDWFPRLQQLARRIALGDFGANDPGFRAAPAEIASLADDLHEMARSLEQHEDDLREALESRIAITREVNHRVRNNLQIVVSLLSLQVSRARNRWERAVLGQVRARLAALALIQRLAYEGEGGTEGRVNIAGLLHQICQQVRTGHDSPGVELSCQSEDIRLSIDQAMPLLLFAVEAISNAFRHAFGPGSGAEGQIAVSLGVSGTGVVRLAIEDDGQGLPLEAGANHMGMDLMQAFAEQLGGACRVESGPGGVKVILEFTPA